MDRVRAITRPTLRSALRRPIRRGTVVQRLAAAPAYLRGLTLGRIGFVLLICFALTERQLSQCVFQVGCGIPDGHTVSGNVLFLIRNFLFALPMLLVVTVADNLTSRAGQRWRVLALSTAVVVGAALYGLAFLLTQPANILEAAAGRQGMFILTYSSRALLYGGLATIVLYLVVREREDARALHVSRLEKLSLDRQTIEAHLQALQAQIEPHFLFNTLANIKLLYETESSCAKPLIHDLAAYLRTALPQMRGMRSTVAGELDLAEAYLRVLKLRMGERLKVIVDVAVGLRDATLPPMMLLTLVENAIKHGLSSLPQGGTITIRAERLAAGLRVSVIDDGVGFSNRFGPGVGIANTRARLKALYGAAGCLTLHANPHGGVIAQIELPCDIPARQLVRL